MRILAIDFGSRRIGLALSDPLGNFAQPLKPLLFTAVSKFIADLKSLMQEKSVQRILLGLPKKMDGSLGPRAQECMRLADTIQRACKVEVELVDERLSTKEAEKILVGELDLSRAKRKEVQDSLAACLILQTYLQQHGTSSRRVPQE